MSNDYFNFIYVKLGEIGDTDVTLMPGKVTADEA